MKVTLERGALLKALGHVHRVVERRTTIPILSNVLVAAEGSSMLLKATDLDLEVTERLPADVGQPGATTLPAHILYEIVRKLPEGAQVSLEGRRRRRAIALAFRPFALSAPGFAGKPTSRISPPATSPTSSNYPPPI